MGNSKELNARSLPLWSLWLLWFPLFVSIHCFEHTLSDFLNADGPPPKLSEVTELTLTRQSHNTILVKWTPPPENYAKAVVAFQIDWFSIEVSGAGTLRATSAGMTDVEGSIRTGPSNTPRSLSRY